MSERLYYVIQRITHGRALTSAVKQKKAKPSIAFQGEVPKLTLRNAARRQEGRCHPEVPQEERARGVTVWDQVNLASGRISDAWLYD